MALLQRSRLAARAADDSAAMLETDVMRFLAIFAFCLVAIFAVVNASTPVAPVPAAAAPIPVPDTAVQDALKSQLATQQARSAQLQQQLRDEQARTARAVAALAAEQPHRRRVKAQTVPPSRAQPKTPAPVLPPPSAADEPAASTPADAVQAAPAVSASRASRAGFSLAFDSDAVLLQMLAAHQVSLYAMRDKAAWQVDLLAGRAHFRPASLRGRFYPMAADTVPQKIASAAPRGSGEIAWRVGLPPDVVNQIQQRMVAASGGDLFIRADGTVQLSP